MILVPINNSTEKFVQIKKVEKGVLLRYVRKTDRKWLYGRSWFVPQYIWVVIKKGVIAE